MIKLLESAKHLVAINLFGDLTAEDVKKANDAIDAALKENERISVFVEVDASMQLTFEGLVKDFIESLGRFGQLSRFYRAAVVTDKGWMAAVARIEGLVFSSLDVRVFEPAEREKALAWVSEMPEPLPKPQPPAPSIRILHTTSDNVFAWEVDGRIREQDIKLAIEHVTPYLDREGKFNGLARISNYNGFDLMAALNNDLFAVKYKAASKIEKYAIIGAKPWMRNLLELLSDIVPAEVMIFDESDEDSAWEWIGASQALLSGEDN